MAINWTIERLSALEPSKLEQVRRNAADKGESALAHQIAKLQASRRAKRSQGRSESPVIGFHFVCPDDYEVELLEDGNFWSGVWAVSEEHCDTAIELRGYVALHKTKAAASHRQGTIVDWRTEVRSKGARQMGVSFLVRPFDQPIHWFGGGAGEKGYRRVDDTPAWAPRNN